jgi:hypothetical protein
MMRENKAQQYRNRAEEARAKAEAVTDEAVKTSLLNDAELWERMAEYEDKNNPRSEPSP